MTNITHTGSGGGKMPPPMLKQPSAPIGFGHINRYWDFRQSVYAAKILPGELYVSAEGEMIVTVLGSCVSACIRDRNLGVGGMNHFMLPEQGTGVAQMLGDVGESTRYGNWAMESLINGILKLGGRRGALEVKLFGGSRVLKGMKTSDVGAGNINFVRDYLHQEGLSIVSEDLGGEYPRKVLYFPDTGSVKIRKLKTMANDKVIQRENQYAETISKPVAGDIELF